MNTVVFIVPCFNASKNIQNIIDSLLAQKNENWVCIFADDISTDNTWDVLQEVEKTDKRIFISKNETKLFALRNIVEKARMYQGAEVIIAVIDGDDSLCNEDAVDILIKEYKSGHDVVWTAHRWDINGMNISKEMPQSVDPYAWPWSSSHLRTFKSTLLEKISDENFKDTKGNWFERGYDQALMLPLLSVSNSRKFVNEVCYLYNINSVSIADRSWEERKQISTINLVRSRGFLK